MSSNSTGEGLFLGDSEEAIVGRHTNELLTHLHVASHERIGNGSR